MFKTITKWFFLYILKRKYYRIGSCNACGQCCQKIYVKHKQIIQTEAEYANDIEQQAVEAIQDTPGTYVTEIF